MRGLSLAVALTLSAALAVPGVFGLFAAQPARAEEASRAVSAASAMVVASVGPAAAAGAEILAAGGNAVDAAVAAGFAASVAHQFSSGLGGGGFFVIHWAATGSSFAVDAREVAPASATPDMYLDDGGEPIPNASRVGGRAVAVPGLVQGFWEVHQRFGVLEWSAVIAPAMRLALEGVALGPHHLRMLGFAEKRLDPGSETARIQLDGGKQPAADWLLVQPELALTLEAIIDKGPAAMVRGPIADAIIFAIAESGGNVSLDDLASYTVKWREPTRGSYRGYEIVSMPPPSSGGVLLVQMLKVLESYDLGAMEQNSAEYIHLVSETMKLAFAERAVHLGDPDFYPVPAAWLTSDTFATRQRARLEPPFFRAPWNWGKPHILDIDSATPAPVEDHGTTHISVADAAGNAVALTQTVNTIFGSQITPKGTGVVLNNEMDDFVTKPDTNTPNAWGLVGGRANSVEPGKRPLSSMTPTILLRDGKPHIVSGSPMGSMIISTVLQTVLNVVDFGMTASDAVSAPRFHHQWKPDELRLEPTLLPEVGKALERFGHPVKTPPYGMGASATIVWNPAKAVFEGGADPRRDSAAAGYSPPSSE